MSARRLWMMWWSGLLAAATFVHLIRVMSGASLVVGAVMMPLWMSGVIVAVAGPWSLWLIQRARGIGDGITTHLTRELWEQWGGVHPCACAHTEAADEMAAETVGAGEAARGAGSSGESRVQ